MHNTISRRGFLIGSSGALAASFLPAAKAEAQNRLIKAMPGNPNIRGSLKSLSMRSGQNWKPDSLKLVYFGMPWNTGCAADLLVIDNVARRAGIAGRVQPVFVYPRYAGRDDVLRNTIRKSGSPFLEVSGAPEDVFRAAGNYRARYFAGGRPLVSGNAGSAPDAHTRFTYLMSPDVSRNLAIFKSDPFDFEMDRIVRTALKNENRGYSPGF